jgi:integrase
VRLLEFCGRESPYYTRLMIALRAGLRVTNIGRITWGHLRNDMSEIYIPDHEMKNDMPFHVPLHAELRAHLREVYMDRWITNDAKPMACDTVLSQCDENRHAWIRLAKKAGMYVRTDPLSGETKTLRFHDLRHTFASWVERHCSWAAVRRLMGHVSRSVTERYVHLSIDELREEIDRLPWLIEGKAEAKLKIIDDSQSIELL